MLRVCQYFSFSNYNTQSTVFYYWLIPLQIYRCIPQLEPGYGSPGHRVTGSMIMDGSGRVLGQSFMNRPGVVTRFPA